MNDTQQAPNSHRRGSHRRGVAEILAAAGWTSDPGHPLTLLRHPSGAVFGVFGASGQCGLDTPGGGGPADFPGSIPDDVVIAACLTASGQAHITPQGDAPGTTTTSPDSPQPPRRHAPHTTAPAPGTPAARHAPAPGSAVPGTGPQEPHSTARAARHPAQKYTDAVVIGDEEYIPMACSQCSWGGYQPTTGRGQAYVCTADGCGYTVDESAFDLYPGDRLTVHNGRLHVARPLSDTPA